LGVFFVDFEDDLVVVVFEDEALVDVHRDRVNKVGIHLEG
jgi:hypothetical protein